MTNRQKVEQLADWAAEDGDPDVLEACSRALLGDTFMEEEALLWWVEWSRIREQSRLVGSV